MIGREPKDLAGKAIQQVLEAGETIQWSMQETQASMLSFKNVVLGLSLISDLVIVGVLWWFKLVEPWLLLVIGIGLLGMSLLQTLLPTNRIQSQAARRYIITNRRLLEARWRPIGLEGIMILPESIEMIRTLAGKSPTIGSLEIHASQHSNLAAPGVPQGRIVRTWNNIDNVQAVQMQIEALRSNSRSSIF